MFHEQPDIYSEIRAAALRELDHQEYEAREYLALLKTMRHDIARGRLGECLMWQHRMTENTCEALKHTAVVSKALFVSYLLKSGSVRTKLKAEEVIRSIDQCDPEYEEDRNGKMVPLTNKWQSAVRK